MARGGSTLPGAKGVGFGEGDQLDSLTNVSCIEIMGYIMVHFNEGCNVKTCILYCASSIGNKNFYITSLVKMHH